MQHTDLFDGLLKDTVNLSQVKLDLLEARVDSIYKALQADDEIGPLILGKSPQGSWAHRTIIEPVGTKEFDADFMLLMAENPAWAHSPRIYIEELYGAIHRHSTYKSMEHTRKCRCVRLVYANSMHVDIVPYLKMGSGRQVIVNRDDDDWEDADPEGFTSWMRDKDDLANGNLRKVMRLMKFLRDHKNSFTGTRSIILTTLLGEQVTAGRKMFNLGYYSNVPTTLVHVVSDLDEWLQARPTKPSIADPSGSGATFDHRWEQPTYSYFRDRIHAHAEEMRAAYDESDPDTSVRLWQAIFGDGFKASAGMSSSTKFTTTTTAADTTVGRSGRAG